MILAAARAVITRPIGATQFNWRVEAIRELPLGARERGSQLKRDNQINGANDLAFQLPARTMRCQNIFVKLCSGKFSNDRGLPSYKRPPRKWFTVSRFKHSTQNRINLFFDSKANLLTLNSEDTWSCLLPFAGESIPREV